MERNCQVVITTSRNPSKVTLELVNDLVNSFPNCWKIARGKKSLATLLEEAKSCGARRVIFVWDWRGMPSRMSIYDVSHGWMPYVLKIVGMTRRRDRAVAVVKRPPAKNVVVVDLAGGELSDIFTEVFQYPTVYSLETVRGKFDTIILIRREERYVVDILGSDLGPRAASLKIDVIYV